MYAMFKRRGLVVTRKCWAELTRSERRATQELGCDEQLWDSNANLPALHEIATWRRFTPAQCHAAAVLGLRQPEGNIEEVAAEEEDDDEDLFEMEKIVVRCPSPQGPSSFARRPSHLREPASGGARVAYRRARVCGAWPTRARRAWHRASDLGVRLT